MPAAAAERLVQAMVAGSKTCRSWDGRPAKGRESHGISVYRLARLLGQEDVWAVEDIADLFFPF